MAQTLINMNKSKVVSSLDTYNYAIPATGVYLIEVQMTENPPSALSIVIKQNTVAKASSTAPTPLQEIQNTQVLLRCAAADAISIEITSATAGEAAPNKIKGIINIQPVALS